MVSVEVYSLYSFLLIRIYMNFFLSKSYFPKKFNVEVRLEIQKQPLSPRLKL